MIKRLDFFLNKRFFVFICLLVLIFINCRLFYWTEVPRFDIYSPINRRIRPLSEGSFILEFEDEEAKDLSIVGGKAASLVELANIPGINVPGGFFITVEAYDNFIENNGITILIKKLDELSKRGKKEEIFEQARLIKEKIINGEFTLELKKTIVNRYRNFSKELGIDKAAVAVRSSATAEDLPTASFAGQQDSFLNQEGETMLLEAVKKSFASLFNERAVDYRNDLGLKHSQVKLSVIVQQQLNPSSAGVGFNVHTLGYEGIYINANYGLGESVVSGLVTPDAWLFNPDTLKLIYRKLGSKEQMVNLVKGGGTQYVEVSPENKEKFSLATEQAREIAKSIKKIGSYYKSKYGYKYIDTEFAVKDGKLYFLQARPETAHSQRVDFKVIDTDSLTDSSKQIVKGGMPASIGVTTGKVKVIKDLNELVTGEKVVEPDDIIVAPSTYNRWTQYLTQFRAIITDIGGDTCHAALISRERKIPAIVGMGNAVSKLEPYERQWITVDAINGVIYKGKLPLRKGRPGDLRALFEVVKPRPQRTLEENIAEANALNILLEDEEGHWIGRPMYPFGKFQLEILWKAFDWLEDRYGFKVDKKIQDNILYTSLERDNTAEVFKTFGIEKLEMIYKEAEENERKFLELSSKFELNEKHFKEWVDLLIKYNAFMDVGFNFRNRIDELMSVKGNSAYVPKYFLNQFQTQIQHSIVQDDELLLSEIYHLASLIIEDGKLKSIFESEDFDVTKVEKQLQTDYKNIYEEFLRVTMNYKIGKGSDIRADMPIGKLLTRVRDEMSKGDPKEILKSLEEERGVAGVQPNIEYFPESHEFQRLVKLSILVRIQMNNFHHRKLRGQWSVREKLLEFGQEMVSKNEIEKAEDIFGLSVEDILALIRKYK